MSDPRVAPNPRWGSLISGERVLRLATLASSVLLFHAIADRPHLAAAIPQESLTEKTEVEIFETVNRHRQSRRLPPLVSDERIRQQARRHSQRMAAGIEPLSHEGFEARITALGIPYLRAAENVASNRGFRDPAAQAVESWLASDAHRKNIEGDFDWTGVGAVRFRGAPAIRLISRNARPG
jgi:uncharacterized protein YkwD